MMIVWDLGATKCAAALVDYQPSENKFDCKKQCSLKLTSCDSLDNLVQQIEYQLNFSMVDADAICIGAAGYYDGEQLQHVNGYPYSMHFAQQASIQQWPAWAVIHDYAPVVCATFTSYIQQSHVLKKLNSQDLNPLGRRVALGIGTGLGLKDGVLFPNGDFWLGENEMGHIGISIPPFVEPFYQKRHEDLIQFLKTHYFLKKNEPITFEKILSGNGLVRLYHFLYAHSFIQQTPEEIGYQLSTGKADELLVLFSWYLGLFVGTVQLAFMPEGGIWITGGVALNHLNAFEHPDFKRGIEASPAYLLKRHTFPIGVLCDPEHTFIGGAYYALRRLISS